MALCDLDDGVQLPAADRGPDPAGGEQALDPPSALVLVLVLVLVPVLVLVLVLVLVVLVPLEL